MKGLSLVIKQKTEVIPKSFLLLLSPSALAILVTFRFQAIMEFRTHQLKHF